MKAPEGESPLDREWWLYEQSLRMMEAQVDRQWAQTQFFILLSASAIGGAITLLQLNAGRAVAFLVMWIFSGAAIFAYAGMKEIANSKRYYRALVAKKTMLEARLGLTSSMPGFEGKQLGPYMLGALATMKKQDEILADVDAYASPKIRWGSSAGWAWTTLAAMAAFDVMAVAWVANALTGCPLAVPCDAL